jgi:hypothetical protein
LHRRDELVGMFVDKSREEIKEALE